MRYAIIVLVFAFCSHSSLVSAQQENMKSNSAVQEEFKDIAADLRCPTCTGLSVLDSDAPFSVQIKNEVKEQLTSGKAKSDILKFFTDRYGPWILREPPKEGIHLWAWIIPLGILIVGPLLLWVLVWTRPSNVEDRDAAEFVVRSMDDIVAEMNSRLASMRGEKP